MHFKILILYEDDQLVVIDKPAGVVVNRAESVKEETIQDWVEKVFKIQNLEFRIDESDFYTRSGIVHRLDKETSGCLVIAKTQESFSKLQAAFKQRLVKKTYLALVHGQIPTSGEINAPVSRLPWNRELFGIVPGGKAAVTRYQVIRYYTSDGDRQARSARHGSSEVKRGVYSLVELYPESGRTHQIRVHLKYLGFPIVGDFLYAGRKQQREDRTWCPRVFLHAAKISFPHPVTGQEVTINAKLPTDLYTVLDRLTSY